MGTYPTLGPCPGYRPCGGRPGTCRSTMGTYLTTVGASPGYLGTYLTTLGTYLTVGASPGYPYLGTYPTLGPCPGHRPCGRRTSFLGAPPPPPKWWGPGLAPTVVR